MAKTIGLNDIRIFFNLTLVQMKALWIPLPQRDKDDIIQGLSNGTLTY